MKASMRYWACNGKCGGNPENSAGWKPGLEPMAFLRLALLLDVINRNQRNSSMLDCNLLIWGFICNVLVGDFVCLIFVWHFFVSTDNVRQFFFPVILVYFIVVLWRRLTCMACYFTGDIVRLTRLLQFWHQCFPQAVVSQLIIRPETRGYGFHYIADGVLPH